MQQRAPGATGEGGGEVANIRYTCITDAFIYYLFFELINSPAQHTYHISGDAVCLHVAEVKNSTVNRAVDDGGSTSFALSHQINEMLHGALIQQ